MVIEDPDPPLPAAAAIVYGWEDFFFLICTPDTNCCTTAGRGNNFVKISGTSMKAPRTVVAIARFKSTNRYHIGLTATAASELNWNMISTSTKLAVVCARDWKPQQTLQ